MAMSGTLTYWFYIKFRSRVFLFQCTEPPIPITRACTLPGKIQTLTCVKLDGIMYITVVMNPGKIIKDGSFFEIQDTAFKKNMYSKPEFQVFISISCTCWISCFVVGSLFKMTWSGAVAFSSCARIMGKIQ